MTPRVFGGRPVDRLPRTLRNAPKTSLRRPSAGVNSRLVFIVTAPAGFGDSAVGVEVVGQLDQSQSGSAGAEESRRHDHERLDQDAARRTVDFEERSTSNHRD